MSPDPSGNDRLGDRPLVLPFAALGAADLPLVGGKGANLGEMTRAGLPVPPGFCVTTEAFRRFVAGDPELEPASAAAPVPGSPTASSLAGVGTCLAPLSGSGSARIAASCATLTRRVSPPTVRSASSWPESWS